MSMQTPQIDSLKGKHTNLSLAFHTPQWSPCPSWSSSEMTFFLRYKCRIQWYFEPCARAPDSPSLQLFPPSSSPVPIRSVLQFTSAGNPDTFPFGKKKHKGSWKHPGHTCAFSDPIPRVQKSCWARGEAAPPCSRSAIWSDWRQYNSCLQEKISIWTMRRCVCAHAVYVVLRSACSRRKSWEMA